jgi:hypothetical protein
MVFGGGFGGNPFFGQFLGESTFEPMDMSDYPEGSTLGGAAPGGGKFVLDPEGNKIMMDDPDWIGPTSPQLPEELQDPYSVNLDVPQVPTVAGETPPPATTLLDWFNQIAPQLDEAMDPNNYYTKKMPGGGIGADTESDAWKRARAAKDMQGVLAGFIADNSHFLVPGGLPRHTGGGEDPYKNLRNSQAYKNAVNKAWLDGAAQRQQYYQDTF